MARYGFDLDGTLDNNPEVAHLARALARDGHKTFILTSSSAGKKAIKAKLYGLNVIKYRKLFLIKGATEDEVGQAKGDVCNANGISLYFENDPKVIAGFRKTSKIAIVQVLPPPRSGPVIPVSTISSDAKSPKGKSKTAGGPVKPRSSCPCETSTRDICLHCGQPLYAETTNDPGLRWKDTKEIIQRNREFREAHLREHHGESE